MRGLVCMGLVLVLAAGCATPPPPTTEADPLHFTQDGIEFQLVRANVTHIPIHWIGHFGMPACAQGCIELPIPYEPGTSTGPRSAGPGSPNGDWTDAALPVRLPSNPAGGDKNTSRDLQSPGAILWHLNATATWSNLLPTAEGPAQLRTRITAVSKAHPDGRQVFDRVSASPLHLEFHDLPTQANETLHLEFSRTGSAATFWDLDFRVLGEAVALRPEVQDTPEVGGATPEPAGSGQTA